jgi:cation transport ATPase
VGVLVAASPSAFVLAAPLARAIAVVRARSAGVLVKDPRALEALARVDVACFEKRGTITAGDLRVTGLVWRASSPDRELLEDLLALELAARHPAARAVAAYLRSRGIEPSSPVTELTEANGVVAGRARDALVEIGSGRRFADAVAHEAPASASIAWFSKNGVPLGYFVLADTIRPHADQALRALWERGLRCRVISGDRRPATQAAANRVGITGYGGLTPSGKALMVRDLQHGGARVLYVRDGEDDGRVAAHADVSIAVAPGTLPSAVSAPILLTEARLDRLPWLFDLARGLRSRLRHAAAVAIVFNAAVLPLAAVGKLTALHAAALMLAETLLVLGNAARLLVRPSRDPEPAPATQLAPPAPPDVAAPEPLVGPDPVAVRP